LIDIATIAPGVFVAVGSGLAAALAWRSERSKLLIKAEEQATQAAVRTQEAQTAYISVLEQRIDFLNEDNVKLNREIDNIKKAEEYCQQERNTLLQENAHLRRRLDGMRMELDELKRYSGGGGGSGGGSGEGGGGGGHANT
jgi:uncharacterized membrane protein YgcG